MSDPNKLTAGEDIMLDLLVARRRLGEYEWPISNRSVRVIHGLMEKGLVTSRHGNVQNTYLVRLTDKAVDEFVTDTEYTPKGYQDYAEQIASYIEEVLGKKRTASLIRKKFGRKS